MTTHHNNQNRDAHHGAEMQLATRQSAMVLLNRSLITNSTALPSPSAIATFLDGADGQPGSGRQTGLDSGLLVWKIRPCTLQYVSFALTDAANETAKAIVGGFRPIRPLAPDPSVKQAVVQWVPMIAAELTITAGALTGVSGGAVTDSEYWADTIEVTKNYQPQPNPERLWGPKNSSDALDPNDTPAHYGFDPAGCSYGFLRISLNGMTAAGVKALEWVI